MAKNQLDILHAGKSLLWTPASSWGERKDTEDMVHGSVWTLEESEGFKMSYENVNWHSVCSLKKVAFWQKWPLPFGTFAEQ